MMDFLPMPTLKHMALVKLVVSLWTEDDVRELVSNFCIFTCDYEEIEFKMFENKMIEKASKLSLPDPLKRKVFGYIRPITMRIMSWVGLLGDRCYIIPKLPSEYCWTPYGFINYEKTAEKWVNDKRFDMISHFRIAVTYCLEHKISDLWKQLPKDIGKDLKYIAKREPQLLCYWLHFLSGKIGQLDTSIIQYCKTDPVMSINLKPKPKCGFISAVSNGNYAATKYFLPKLTPEEKDNIIVQNAAYVVSRRLSTDGTRFPKHSYTDILCLLLSTMNEAQQISTFSQKPNLHLRCFLDWPWQGLFVELLKREFISLTAEEYYNLLKAISNKIVEGYKDYDYQNLFVQVWQKVPNANKDYVVNLCVDGTLLLNMLKVKAKEYIILMLNDATAGKKEEIIFSENGKETCKFLVENNLLDMFECFVQTCVSSKDMMMKFKTEFKDHILSFYSNKRVKNGVWKKCFQLLDRCIRKWNKRINVEEGDHSAKKLCSAGVKQGGDLRKKRNKKQNHMI